MPQQLKLSGLKDSSLIMKIIPLLHLDFSQPKTNSGQDTAYVKNKGDGGKVVLKTQDPILQMLYD